MKSAALDTINDCIDERLGLWNPLQQLGQFRLKELKEDVVVALVPVIEQFVTQWEWSFRENTGTNKLLVEQGANARMGLWGIFVLFEQRVGCVETSIEAVRTRAALVCLCRRWGGFERFAGSHDETFDEFAPIAHNLMAPSCTFR